LGQRIANLLHVVWFAVFLYLWLIKGRIHLSYDTIAVSITALEVILVVGGIFGFTYFQFVAERKAEKVAKDAVAQEVERLLPATVRRILKELREESEKLGSDNSSEKRMQEMMDSLDGKSGEDGK